MTFGDISLTYKTVDDSSAELITFYIDCYEDNGPPADFIEIAEYVGNVYRYTYYAEEGMTWDEWADSSCDTNDIFKVVDNWVQIPDDEWPRYIMGPTDYALTGIIIQADEYYMIE